MSVAFSAMVHLAVAFGGVWVAEVGAFESPRPPKASITFLTIASKLPVVVAHHEASPIDRSAPTLARTRVAAAPAPLPEPPAHAPVPAPVPLDTRPIEMAKSAGVIQPEPARIEIAPPPAIAPTPMISVGAFDRTTGSRTSPSAQVVRVASESALQSARAAPVAQRSTGDDVRAGLFDARAAPPRAVVAASKPEPVDVPVEIVFKPTPDYTDEAKALRIQGDVILEVEFTASGTVRVLRIVGGLGYGLDETAARAATQIHFKPAQTGGRAVDVRTTVRIVFRLS